MTDRSLSIFLRGYLHLFRLHQWLKNLILLFPPFLAGSLGQPDVWRQGVLPFLAFGMAASATYVFNDVVDLNRDSLHPVKSRRPLPSGLVTRFQALPGVAVLVLGSVSLAASVSPLFLTLLLCYLVVSTLYTLQLKNLPIVDIFCISTGFVLRLFAGGEAFGVVVSQWLFLSVFLLSVFLSLGKRLSEKSDLGEEAGAHRNTLKVYPAGFLEGCMYMSGAAVLVCYTMYTLPYEGMIYTVPLCAFGLFRYILRIKSGLNGDPTESLLRDPQLFVISLSWALMVGWAVYV